MRIISFATPGPYEAELIAMAATVACIPGITIAARTLDAPVSWRDATLHKPRFILGQLCFEVVYTHSASAPEEPVVWLDADARVEQPDAFVAYVDSAATLNPGTVGFHLLPRNFAPGSMPEVLTSTIIFAPPLWRCLQLVSAWCGACERFPGNFTPDQQPLERMLGEHQGVYGRLFFELPPEMCWIDAQDPAVPIDISERVFGKRKPIVRQTQASRRLKNANP
jgi:hypothetical protein